VKNLKPKNLNFGLFQILVLKNLKNLKCEKSIFASRGAETSGWTRLLDMSRTNQLPDKSWAYMAVRNNFPRAAKTRGTITRNYYPRCFLLQLHRQSVSVADAKSFSSTYCVTVSDERLLRSRQITENKIRVLTERLLPVIR